MVTAVDSSGNGNDGTYTGVDGNPGRVGLVTGNTSVFFTTINGVANVLTPPSLLDFSAPWTIACLWANPENNSLFDAYLADPASGPYLEFKLRDGAGSALEVTTGFLTWQSNNGAVPADGLAHLVAFTFDDTNPSTGVFYVDGVVIPNATEPISAVPGNAMVTAGINGDLSGSPVGSSILDEWACWNRVLSGGEISSLQAARGSFAAYNTAVLGLSPTAYYHFDEFPLPSGWHVGRIEMGA